MFTSVAGSMIVTCPSCDTHFNLSPSAMGPEGRRMRCSRCGNKWHATPEREHGAPRPAAQTPPPPPSPPPSAPPTAAPPTAAPAPRAAAKPPRRAAAPRRDDIPLEAPAAEAPRRRDTLADHLAPSGDDFDLDLDLDEDPAAKQGPDYGAMPAEASSRDDEPEEDPFAKISELMMSSPPEPIPDVFANPAPRPSSRRKGAAGLWLLLVVLLLSGLGAGAYFLQDRIIDKFPEAAQLYDSLGVRNEVVGAGLAFRNYNSERLVQENNEVLIVRGVIANTTEQPHEIPLLRLALYNNQTLLQEKIISPPQTSLDAHGTVGFRITLDQPDANASRFEVTFTAAKPPGPQ